MDFKTDNLVFLYLACILAGFAIIKISTTAAILISLKPILIIIAVIVILLFSFLIIWKGIKTLMKK
ncbi:hypothetical protein IMZ08_05540 [Bacillus luteolus]|uniref:Uncharacterized protein n=1 Tax=Litchfieldia luteola TaxID=682179 RepID=A0ABR9QGA6_9BACI|nr:hypothetical protein [Cytobacillus luteolus]MBE4907526.1 hypothetical protein [Cytobacillus luteolus]MBP1944295.1 amino acid transporter [Cytobacillus luteolus]